jgi:hypothetical protein
MISEPEKRWKEKKEGSMRRTGDTVRAICVATTRHRIFSLQSPLSFPGAGAVQTLRKKFEENGGNGNDNDNYYLLVYLVPAVLHESARGIDTRHTGMKEGGRRVYLCFELETENLVGCGNTSELVKIGFKRESKRPVPLWETNYR